MIKLKQLLLEAKAPSIFIPRRMEDRVERMIKVYIRNGSKGNLSLSEMELTVLPDILKDINVDGDFYCNGNKLTSLNNVPNSIRGSFNCSSNELTSLIGAPSSVNGNFFCGYNKLTSLIGAPSSVGGDFWCANNNVQFTEAQVRAVCDVKGTVYVK